MSVALYRLLRELYPMPAHRRFRITKHAVDRAVERWQVPSRSAAEQAIWVVLRRGTPGAADGEGRIGIRYGPRTCVVAPNGAVTTVWVDGKNRVEAIIKKTRLDRLDLRRRRRR